MSTGGCRAGQDGRQGPGFPAQRTTPSTLSSFVFKSFPPVTSSGGLKYAERGSPEKHRLPGLAQGSPLCGRQLRLEPALQGSHLFPLQGKQYPFPAAACEGSSEGTQRLGGIKQFPEVGLWEVATHWSRGGRLHPICPLHYW